jgi:hypothetical protein
MKNISFRLWHGRCLQFWYEHPNMGDVLWFELGMSGKFYQKMAADEPFIRAHFEMIPPATERLCQCLAPFKKWWNKKEQ